MGSGASSSLLVSPFPLGLGRVKYAQTDNSDEPDPFPGPNAVRTAGWIGRLVCDVVVVVAFAASAEATASDILMLLYQCCIIPPAVLSCAQRDFGSFDLRRTDEHRLCTNKTKQESTKLGPKTPKTRLGDGNAAVTAGLWPMVSGQLSCGPMPSHCRL